MEENSSDMTGVESMEAVVSIGLDQINTISTVDLVKMRSPTSHNGTPST